MSAWLELLTEELPAEVLERARKEQDAADFLLQGRHLPAHRVLDAVSRSCDRPALLLDSYEPESEALGRVTEETARRFRCLPLFLLRGRLYVAIADPGDLAAEDYLAQLTGLPIELVGTTAASVQRAITRWYLAGGKSAAAPVPARATAPATPPPPPPPKKAEAAPAEVQLGSQESPSVAFVRHMLTSAVHLRASDIHLEPFEDGGMLRYRLDGLLREYPPPPPDLMKAVTSRIKILSNLDVSERRLPQDGRATVEVDGRCYDLRVSIIPNLFGESVVIRVLDLGGAETRLTDLGFDPGMLERYLKLSARPHGIVLVTGPTGSGKSTTLYATLRHLMSPERKIITLEDPIESQIKGLTQFQMNSGIGFTFARALRSVLRHDPEIVLVGEIRDLETAEIAIRTSLTGHMLFSTLHTNDAPSAATRLIDMGVAGYMVMTTLQGVLAQRLLRRLCPHCKIPAEPEPALLQALGLEALPPGAVPCRPVGCGQCAKIGYRGRVGVYELLEVTTEMRRLPAEDMTAERLRELAAEDGFVSIRDSAREKWCQGLTGADEVLRLTMEA